MRKLIAVMGVVACAASAQAGEGAEPFTWTGVYFGGHGGYGWSNVDMSVNDGFESQVLFPGTDTIDASGGLVGLQGGAQYQSGAWVFGVEADISWADMSGDGFFATEAYLKTGGTDGTSWTDTTSIDKFGTVRGRLGYASGGVLFYGTAGWAWADVEANHVVAVDGIDPHRTSTVDRTFSGYAVGLGLEWALNRNLTLKGEYLLMDFGRESFPHDVGNVSGDPDLTSADIEMQLLRLGLNLKFP